MQVNKEKMKKKTLYSAKAGGGGVHPYCKLRLSDESPP